MPGFRLIKFADNVHFSPGCSIVIRLIKRIGKGSDGTLVDTADIQCFFIQIPATARSVVKLERHSV
ncbi:hypothetical protein CWS02_23115 [Enterobacter sp. EA-1]|nr:hypothetical protein CWS02_23115 [Enterobacter sp. EA-1]